jgi:hypothetical protein
MKRVLSIVAALATAVLLTAGPAGSAQTPNTVAHVCPPAC